MRRPLHAPWFGKWTINVIITRRKPGTSREIVTIGTQVSFFSFLVNRGGVGYRGRHRPCVTGYVTTPVRPLEIYI